MVADMIKIFAGSSHPKLAEAIAKGLDSDLGEVELKRFSGGERYVRFMESVRGKEVFLVQTATENTNEDLIELFLMCQAAQLSFAKSVHVVIPFFPYARQDRVAEYREPISAKLMAHLLEESGADHIMTFDMHSDQIQGFFSVPVDSLRAVELFASYIESKNIKDLVVVSPDVGGAKRAKKLSDLLGAELAIMHKTRPEHHETEIVDVVGDIEGKTCILYDDMIDTAGSLVSAKKALTERGANEDVYAAATHGIFSGKAIQRLTDAKFKEVIVTDTVPNAPDAFPGLHIISIAPMLTNVIRNVVEGISVTNIYKK